MSADEADGSTAKGVCVEGLVFDEENKERPPWTSPCGTKVPRSEVVFITQICLIFSVVIFCIIQLSLPNVTCEESTIYIAILSSCATYLIPPPQRQ